MARFNSKVKKMSQNFMANANVIRKENGLSLRGLARETDISATTIRRIETARKTRFGKGNQGYTPSLNTIVKMAEAVGTTPNALLMTRITM